MVEDPDELAILSQQQGQRMAESAVARMLESGALRIENKRFIAVPDRRAGLSRRGLPGWATVCAGTSSRAPRWLRAMPFASGW